MNSSSSTELIRGLQGDMNQGEYAELLGISRPFLNLILNGHREPGLLVMRGLLRAFPDNRDEIVEAFELASSRKGKQDDRELAASADPGHMAVDPGFLAVAGNTGNGGLGQHCG